MAAAQLLICAVVTLALRPVSGQLAGGISNATVSRDEEPVTFAMDAINQMYANISAATNASYTPRELIAILSARQQVVAGMKYYLTLLTRSASQEEYICDVDVWFRAWLTGAERLQVVGDVICVPFDGSSPQSNETTSTTPAIPDLPMGEMPGGISNATLSRDEEPVTFAVDAINEKYGNLSAATNASYTPRELIAILSARQQVVAGMTYDLTLLMRSGSQEEYICDAKVWFRPWLTGAERLQVVDDPMCVPFNGSSPQSTDTTTTTTTAPLTLKPAGMSQSASEALLYAIRRLNQKPSVLGAYSFQLGDTSKVTLTQKGGRKTIYLFRNVKLVRTTCHYLDRFLTILYSNHTCYPVGRPMFMTCTLQVLRQIAWFYPMYSLISISC